MARAKKQQESQKILLEPVPHGVSLQNIFVRTLRVNRTVHPPSEHHAHFEITETSATHGIGICCLEVQIDKAPDEIYAVLVSEIIYGSLYSDEEALDFMRFGILTLLLPYVRELVSHLSVRMGLKPIMLAPYSIRSKPEETKNDDRKSLDR